MEDEEVLERILDGAEDPKDLPFALLQKITGNFSRDRKIGQGGFGEVYKGILGQKIVAVKRIHINESTFDDRLFRREFASLWNTNHRNVVRFLGFCSNTYQKTIQDTESGAPILASVLERLLCFEYIGNGSLDKHITDELRGLEWKTRYEIIIGICKGLRYLHEDKEIIHMDLKPANILLHNQDDKYMIPKITDFGLSRPNEKSHTVGKCYGTRGYWAPEYRDDSRTTPACDIYSLGAIITELVTGCMEVPNKHNVLRRWRHRWNKPPTQLQYQQVTRCMGIAGSCREQKPEDRPSISKIIRFLSESESTHGQISPCFNEDDMLGIKPLELLLPSELKNETSHSVELTNATRHFIAFYIQLPSLKYIAQPEKGIVQPESKCSVKITVQPRDCYDSDKFVVKSMKVSQVLIDEDITEHMFEEAGKVVDDVNLVVVYEPMKPLKISREGASMPAEEVPEAKKRKIGESASGKGKNKLGSSEKEEAASMKDISSSALGQCTEQRKQCKFYPPQSFSRHYPTNRKYLGRESDRAMDVARGAMGSLLDKLGKLVTEDYGLDTSIKNDIESLSVDLTKIHLDLPQLENVGRAKVFVEEVRELSYNTEDMIDSFLVHVEPDSSTSGFKEIMHESVKLLENGMTTHHQIGDVIRYIKEKVQALADRQKKYNFDVRNVVANATIKATTDLRVSAMYEHKEQLVGIKAPRDELIRLLEDDGDASKQKLKIISIVGMGGLGKTTLAKAVYDQMKAYYPKVFVSVGQNPDVETVLKKVLHKIQNNFNAENLDMGELIEKLKNNLKDKRYFIVIDDIWGFQELYYPLYHCAGHPLLVDDIWDAANRELDMVLEGANVGMRELAPRAQVEREAGAVEPPSVHHSDRCMLPWPSRGGAHPPRRRARKGKKPRGKKQLPAKIWQVKAVQPTAATTSQRPDELPPTAGACPLANPSPTRAAGPTAGSILVSRPTHEEGVTSPSHVLCPLSLGSEVPESSPERHVPASPSTEADRLSGRFDASRSTTPQDGLSGSSGLSGERDWRAGIDVTADVLDDAASGPTAPETLPTGPKPTVTAASPPPVRILQRPADPPSASPRQATPPAEPISCTTPARSARQATPPVEPNSCTTPVRSARQALCSLEATIDATPTRPAGRFATPPITMRRSHPKAPPAATWTLGAFLEAATKQLNAALPTPGKRPRKQQLNFTPRRGRSAMAGKAGPPTAERRAQVQLLRTLGIIGADQKITAEELKAYGNVFATPISFSILSAIAALLGRTIPAELMPTDAQPRECPSRA